jgi:hypothetical protein
MRYRVILRSCVALVYLGMLGVVVGAVLGRMTAFEGTVVVAEKRTESLALRPGSEGTSFSLTRNMPLDVLPLDNPQAARSLLDNKKNYDAAALGLRLRLDEISVLAPAGERDVIEVTPSAGPAVTIGAHPGATVPLAAGACTIRSVEPWAGLVRDAAGRRMAAFSFQRKGTGDWVQGLFTEAGQWTILPPEMALRLDWVDSENAARAGLPPARPGLDAARWSVAEKGRVHWFETFTTGTGETLGDGTEYVLLGVNTDPEKNPAIVVGIRKAGKARRVEVPANAAQPLEGLRFEYPGAMPVLVIARAWRDGAAWIESFRTDSTLGPIRLEDGGQWEATPALRFRLDQTMLQGLPVGLRGAPVWMAAVSTGGGELLRLREGLSLRCGDSSLRYRRLPQPPVVRYAFQALSLTGRPIETFVLGPGEKHRVQEWLFTQAADNLNAGRTALLTAKRLPASRYGVVGLMLALAGAAGWVLAQIRLRGDNIEPAWTDLKPVQGDETDPPFASDKPVRDSSPADTES